MNWKEFKQEVERKGIKDETPILWIDWDRHDGLPEVLHGDDHASITASPLESISLRF